MIQGILLIIFLFKIIDPHAQIMQEMVSAVTRYGPMRFTNFLYRANLMNITYYMTIRSTDSASNLNQATVLVDYIWDNIWRDPDLYHRLTKLLQDESMDTIYSIVIKLSK